MTGVRSLHAHKQTAGMVLSLVGALLTVWGRLVPGSPQLAVPAGLTLVAIGWALFAYVIVMRTRYVRAQIQNGDS